MEYQLTMRNFKNGVKVKCQQNHNEKYYKRNDIFEFQFTDLKIQLPTIYSTLCKSMVQGYVTGSSGRQSEAI